MKNIPFIKISAKTNYELGFKIGKKLKNNIKRRITACKKLYSKMGIKSFPDLENKAMEFLPDTAKHFPDLVVEAEGLSRGADVKFEEIMVLMCEEEIIDLKIPKCTSIAIKNKEGVLIGHNEDWLTSYENNGLYILNCKLNSHHSLSLNYIGTLAGSSSGLNDKGLCFTANSLNPKRFRYGIPIKFQFRAILESDSPHEAIQEDISDSSICGNTMYGWKDSRIFDVEDYFGHHELYQDNKFLIHTNHPLLAKNRNNQNTEAESMRRYERVKKILDSEKNFNIEILKKILSDHKAKICAHPSKNSYWGPTIASIIMNPEEKWIEVCWSNPCKNRYFRYNL